MKALRIPPDLATARQELLDLLGPVAEHPAWRRLATELLIERGLLLYRGETEEEMVNLSNWFNLINDRCDRYDSPTVHGLYVAHELAHLLTPTPWSATVDDFADAFHRSERVASYETELAIHADLPTLRAAVPWAPLLATWLEDRGVDLGDAPALLAWRDAVIAQPGLLAALPGEAARLAGYGETRRWAADRWQLLRRLGWWDDPVAVADWPARGLGWRTQPSSLDLDAPETAERWQRNTCRTIEVAARLTGERPQPSPRNLIEGRARADQLTGKPLLTRGALSPPLGRPRSAPDQRLFGPTPPSVRCRRADGSATVMSSVYSLPFRETNAVFDDVDLASSLCRVGTERESFDRLLREEGLGPLPDGGGDFGLLDLIHEPILNGIIDRVTASMPGFDGDRLTHRYPLHGSSPGIGMLLAHLRHECGVEQIHVLAGDYEGYRAQAAHYGLGVVTVERDRALATSGATWFVSAPSAIDGHPLPPGFLDELVDRNARVVADVAYHGLAGSGPTPVPAGAWAWLWSLSKPYGLFWRRVGAMAAAEPIPAAYATRWFKDPGRLLAGWRVVQRFEASAMADRYRPLQHAAIDGLRSMGANVTGSPTLLMANVERRGTDPDLWRQVAGAERVPGTARVCLTPMIEEAVLAGGRG